MTKIIVSGACGRMGRTIVELAATDPEVDLAGLVDVGAHEGSLVAFRDRSVKVQAAWPHVAGAVAIEFTSPEATVAHARECVVHAQPMVIGTTGLSIDQQREIEHAARKVAIVQSGNMSTGMNLLVTLVRRAAAIAGLDADIEVVEAHHNKKKDAPSGSAMMLALAAAEGRGQALEDVIQHGRSGQVGERPRGQIGMHAVRGGDIIGDHTVTVAMHGERLEFVHRAHTRSAFSIGALRAAKYAATAKPGLHTMARVLGLEG